MNIRREYRFDRDFKHLPYRIQDQAEKQFRLLLANPHHPSLRTKKMSGEPGRQGTWEARITKGYRFTFRIDGNTYVFRRIGPHDILKQP